MKVRTSILTIAFVIASSSWLVRVAHATPDDGETCATAAENAQRFRDEGHYRRAHAELLSCSRDTCPAPIRKDCNRWLSDVERDAPTVVLGAKNARGDDLVEAGVSVDGEPLVERLDGKPVTVDSGEHVFTFRFRNGAVEQRKVVLRAAEKSRAIVVTANDTTTTSSSPPQRPSLVLPIALASVGVVALGSFAVFAITGQNGYDDLEQCKPFCNASRVDSVDRKFLVADVSLGVGLVAFAAATYFYLTRRVPTEPSVAGLHIGGGAVAGGGYGSLDGRF